MTLNIVTLLQYWYTNQQLHAGLGSVRSLAFTMNNGIRQGSVLSPHLFSVYVDDLSHMLNGSGLGCHIAGTPANNFSYADDLAIVCPSAVALNDLLRVCEQFARDHYIVYNTTKSVCMCATPKGYRGFVPPAIYLNNEKLSYVDSFYYLGHIITSDISDDEDIKREIRSLSARGNALIRTFKFCNDEVKLNLFKTYCYSFYCGSLWCNYKSATMNRLRVTYNNVMRRLANYPMFHSASMMFVSLNVKGFKELRRAMMYSMRTRLSRSSNRVIANLFNSDARALSPLWHRWDLDLFVQ